MGGLHALKKPAYNLGAVTFKQVFTGHDHERLGRDMSFVRDLNQIYHVN